MGIFDFFKGKGKDIPSENIGEKVSPYDVLINNLLEETAAKSGKYSIPSLTSLDNFKPVEELENNSKKEFGLIAARRLNLFWKSLEKPVVYSSPNYPARVALERLCKYLLSYHFSYSDEELLEFATLFHPAMVKTKMFLSAPHDLLVDHIERVIEQRGLSKELEQALQLLITLDLSYSDTRLKKLNEKIRFLLQGTPDLRIDANDPFGASMISFLNALEGERKSIWRKLFDHLSEAGEKSAPSAKWLKDAGKMIDEIGREEYTLKCEEWITLCTDRLRELHKTYQPERAYLKDLNHELLKSMIWTAGILNVPSLNIIIDTYGILAYKKATGIGALSAKTGNACLYCFSILPFQEGVARLTKFRMKIKYPSILKHIDKYLNLVAKREGYTAERIEELAVPDFGIGENGILQVGFGDYTAVFEINGIYETKLSWKKEAKSQASVPAIIKSDYVEELKDLKRVIKEIETLLPAQRDRIEQSFLRSRKWKFSEWNSSYIEHPLVSIVAKKLIWEFSSGEQKADGIFHGGSFVEAGGERINWLNENTEVKLWHPIYSSPDEVLRWREYLIELSIVQPFKQAYREVYIVTDAELNTQNYSNRFAAHILRQHQFAALLKQRGWHYTIMGNWDSHNTPYFKIPETDLEAQFTVDSDWNDNNTNDAGIFTYISTDQVRFVRERTAINMVDVPPMIFTEVMRDVDLFVGVTSIGNDPNWRDGGRPVLDGYWHKYSFGELLETAKMRKTVLEKLLPRLKIASVCEITDRFLVVKGKLKTYKIHIGSTNILMEPNDQYLCIVPDRSSKTPPNVFLPFEGDAGLSIILSKAFMLSEDDKIKDTSIVNQIKRK